jgi:hypothetical protein
MNNMKKIVACLLALLILNPKAYSFCGFYVAKADAKIFNKGSQVILVRNGDKTTLTMSNDYQGDAKYFAMVVPVPVVLKEGDVKIANQAMFDSFDAYSGPRLVSYYDQNPCYDYSAYKKNRSAAYGAATQSEKSMDALTPSAVDHHVTIEAKYTVGEYDILVLSAKESTGLKDWLTENGYVLPTGAEDVLDPYIKNNLKFFVVKVNMEKFKAAGFQNLRPLQISYESPKFMLPIRLGMANSTGSQDLIVYAFTKTGRVECTNYRTIKMPSGRNIPLDIQNNFGKFYKSVFKKQYGAEGKNGVFLEYAWNVSPTYGQVKCDPCVGPPPVFAQLKEAGVDWLDASNAGNVFFTRLHVRYTRDKFPQDLFFQVTPNTETFQARYIITHPASGDFSCDEGQSYVRALSGKRRTEVNNLYALTGWNTEKYKTYIYEYNHYLGKQTDDEDDESIYVTPINEDGSGKRKIYLTGLLLSVLLLTLVFNPRRKPKKTSRLTGSSSLANNLVQREPGNEKNANS